MPKQLRVDSEAYSCDHAIELPFSRWSDASLSLYGCAGNVTNAKCILIQVQIYYNIH